MPLLLFLSPVDGVPDAEHAPQMGSTEVGLVCAHLAQLLHPHVAHRVLKHNTQHCYTRQSNKQQKYSVNWEKKKKKKLEDNSAQNKSRLDFDI